MYPKPMNRKGKPEPSKPSKPQIETDSDWLPVQAAADWLGVSVRQVQNRAAQGEIEKRVLPKAPHERAARVEYRRRDLDRIKAGFRSQTPAGPAPPVTAVAVRPPAAVAPFAALADSTAASEAFEAIHRGALHLAALAAALPPAGKWLTLKEAAEYSGLPARWLRAAARAGKLRAQNVGEKRERWMFPREGLN